MCARRGRSTLRRAWPTSRGALPLWRRQAHPLRRAACLCLLIRNLAYGRRRPVTRCTCRSLTHRAAAWRHVPLRLLLLLTTAVRRTLMPQPSLRTYSGIFPRLLVDRGSQIQNLACGHRRPVFRCPCRSLTQREVAWRHGPLRVRWSSTALTARRTLIPQLTLRVLIRPLPRMLADRGPQIRNLACGRLLENPSLLYPLRWKVKRRDAVTLLLVPQLLRRLRLRGRGRAGLERR